MNIYRWKNFCLAADDAALLPAGAEAAEEPFAPLVIPVRRDPKTARGLWHIRDVRELREQESIGNLLPLTGDAGNCALSAFVALHGASVLNVSFSHAYDCLTAFSGRPKNGLKATLVGLGDVGGTVLTALKLLGRELSEISIFDMNPAACARYELELNQVIPVSGEDAETLQLPRITVCSEEKLFDCDLFLFTASRGVPGLDSGVKDVRMAQFDANRKMLDLYAKKAREAGYMGMFCQISDPVDHLAREVFLASNRNDAGDYDWSGLLPEQVQGFGLGVMRGRAAYYAAKKCVDFTEGRVYGPHGAGLIVANSAGDDYDEAISEELTALTREANLRVRELGYKPYIAPGISSAAISVLQMLRGETHVSCIPLDGAYFGCRNRLTEQGVEILREPVSAQLFERIREAHRALKEFPYEQ